MPQEGQIIEVILQSAGADGQGVILSRGDVSSRGPQELRETIEDVVANGSTAQVQSLFVQLTVTWPLPAAWLSCKCFAECSCVH